MLDRRPLFPGRNTTHQMQLIIETLGVGAPPVGSAEAGGATAVGTGVAATTTSPPPQGTSGTAFSSSGAIDVSAAVIDETQLAWLKGLPSYKHVVAMARAAAARRARDGRPYRPLDFSRRWPNTSPEGRDLLARMLCFDPSKRITAAVALAHPYLSDYACPEDEPVAQPPDLAEWQVREPGTMAARRRDGVLGRLNASREWDSFDLGHWHHLSPSLLAPSLPPRSSSLTTAGPPSPSWRRRWRRRWRTSRCRRRPSLTTSRPVAAGSSSSASTSSATGAGPAAPSAGSGGSGGPAGRSGRTIA
jgi:serine/threonine protein kinase